MFRTSKVPTRLLTQKFVKKKGERKKPREAIGLTISCTVEGVGLLSIAHEGSIIKFVDVADISREKEVFDTSKLPQIRLDNCLTRDVALL